MLHRLAILFALLLTPFAAAAHEGYAVGPLRVTQPWSRALPPVSANGAVYFSVKNTGKTPDRLVGGSTPIAQRVELHQHSMDGGVMRMRQVPTIDISPGGTAALKPGGFHAMLLGLKEPLTAGKNFPMTLEFERAGQVQVQVQIQTVDATGPGESAHPGHAAAPAETSDVRRFDLAITGGTVAADKKRIRVTQGERVELHWTSDTVLTLHLHGYDIEVQVTPAAPAAMRFGAHATGRFPVETHGGGHGALLYFEVYPK